MQSPSNLIKIGPIGKDSGKGWDERGRTEIVQILVSHEDGINSIQFQYADNGTLQLSDRHGENLGKKFDAVKFNYPSEYLTWVSGYSSYYNDYLTSITFGTNHGTYGPFGEFKPNDQLFSFQLGKDRQFGGFYGTADSSKVGSIGVYLKPITTLENIPKKSSFLSRRKIFGVP